MNRQGAPRSLRLHIGLFGRTNSGKSSFLNMVSGQDSSIVSPVPGTTTDVVSKAMELLPVGPVVFLDTAGVDDASSLGALRIERTRRALDSSDLAVLILEGDHWTDYEAELAAACADQNTPLVLVVNKIDLGMPQESRLRELRGISANLMCCSCVDGRRESYLLEFKRLVLQVCPEGFLDPPTILGDLLPSGRGLPLVALIVPIDLQAPKGRIILPQVQAIRDALDSDAAVAVVKEREYGALLERLSAPPDLAVCDSQIVLKMVADTPASVPCTTFSILFSRYKGDLDAMAAGAAVLSTLKDGDRILIAEACSHHALEDDIGRVKIPRWIRQFSGADLRIEHSAGSDYPEDLGRFRLVVHCGACSLTRRQMLWRLERARTAGVAVTNYGVAISALQGVVERTLSPFPSALQAYRSALETAPALEAARAGVVSVAAPAEAPPLRSGFSASWPRTSDSTELHSAKPRRDYSAVPGTLSGAPTAGPGGPS